MPSSFSHPGFQGRFGIAQTDITPPIGVYARNWGAARHDVATSIHRPLLLSVLTLSTTGEREPLVYIDADLGWWKTPQLADNFRERLLTDLSLPPENLVFALSHTHAGPPLMEADDSLPGMDLLSAWTDGLFSKAVDTVRQALNTIFDGTLDWHTGRCRLATVRDFPDPDPDNERILCGYQPDAEADDTLLVGRVTDSSGALRATLVNYACHPTTLAWDNTAISPDYVGAMRQTVRDATGAPALFALGACGDLAPRVQYVSDLEIADRHGRQLAFAALATLADMEPPATRLNFAEVVESGAPLAVWKHQPRALDRTLQAKRLSVELPLKDWPAADELERQRQACTDRALEERLRRKRDIRRWLGNRATFEMEVVLWRIGESVLVGTCGEPYSILQRELRSRFPDRAIVCMNLVNGSIGYLPVAELYDEDVYPVWQTPFARGSLERIMEAMTDAIEEALTDE